MELALTIVVAIIAVGLWGTWSCALWRGWRHACSDMTPAERRLPVWGLAALLLLSAGLGVLDVAAKTANIAIGMAAVAPILIIVGVRDHRRRERRIQARRHGTPGPR